MGPIVYPQTSRTTGLRQLTSHKSDDLSEELIGTTEGLTLWTICCISRFRYNRVQLYIRENTNENRWDWSWNKEKNAFQELCYCSFDKLSSFRLVLKAVLLKYNLYIVKYYVYWTVLHFDSWITIDQLDVTCFIISLFTVQHVSSVSTSIFRSLRHIVILFRVLYCFGSMCVGVTVWFGWGGVVSLCRLKHCFILYRDTTPSQPNHTLTPTHIEPEQ
jgi:hypothetical protein